MEEDNPGEFAINDSDTYNTGKVNKEKDWWHIIQAGQSAGGFYPVLKIHSLKLGYCKKGLESKKKGQSKDIKTWDQSNV